MERDHWTRVISATFLVVSVVFLAIIPVFNLGFLGLDFGELLQWYGFYIGLFVDVFAAIGVLFPERYLQFILNEIEEDGEKTRQVVKDSISEILTRQEDSVREENSKDERVIQALDKLTRKNLIAKSYGKFQLLNTIIPIWGRGAPTRPFKNWEKISIALLFEYPKKAGSKKLKEYTEMNTEDYNETIQMHQDHFVISKKGLLTLSPYGYNTILQTIEDISGAKDMRTGVSSYTWE